MNTFTAPLTRGRWIAAALGLLLPVAFAPFNWFWLAPLTLAGLFVLWVDQSPREAAWRGLCFGLGAFTTGTYWLYISLHMLGGAPLPVVLTMMAVLILLLAIYPAVCGWLSLTLCPAATAVRWLLVVPAAWTLLEWTRGWFLTGFSWLSIGYSQIDSPLAAWAPIVGVHGVSWITVFVAGLIPWALRGDRIIRASAAGVCVLVFGVSTLLLPHAWTQSTGGDLKIALIQGAIPQELKWLREQRLPTLETYGRMSLDLEHQDLIIWPEVAIPALPEQVEPFLDGMRKRMVERHSQLFAGILTYDTVRDQYRNTLLSLGDPPGEYHKRHLVPFGEYFPVPGFVRELMRLMNLPYETTSAGDRHQAPLMLHDIAVAPSICYEVAFGAEQLDFLPEAGLLINVSNDAWFGNSIAPHQHLQMARMRALEAGRYMLRATNTGITAVVGPDGRLRESIPQFKRAVLTAIVHAYTGATPYVRTGNWAIVCLSMLVLLLAGLVRIRGG